jgi:hypothetical protein
MRQTADAEDHLKILYVEDNDDKITAFARRHFLRQGLGPGWQHQRKSPGPEAPLATSALRFRQIGRSGERRLACGVATLCELLHTDGLPLAGSLAYG